MVRLDVDNGSPYSIPVDNPLFESGGRAEIYAWGFRNPWRWNFDRVTGEIWLGDVGQNEWEEINRIEKGGNYGWNIREGAHCPESPDCDPTGLIDPIVEYSHAEGCAVTGGYVYRGARIPHLQGTYLYGDFCNGQIWGLTLDGTGKPLSQLLIDSSNINLVSFAQDHAGEMYVLDYFEGHIFQLVPNADLSTPQAFPTKLSETGCVDPNDPEQVAPELLAYDINVPFWSDGADKQRWFTLPPNETIEIQADGNWDLPVGSVVVKNFRLAGQLIETRLLVHHRDGPWAGYSYEWNDAQTEAVYVQDGKIREIQGVNWIYPSSAQCPQCHTLAAGNTLGLETAQMNRDHQDPVSGQIDNQLSTLDYAGIFDPPLTTHPAQLPSLPNSQDETTTVESRARAYLHSNCAQCHRPGGPTPVDMDLRGTTALQDMNVCDVLPGSVSLGLPDARLVKPGAPAQSVLLARMSRRDFYGMPPLGSSLIDEQGILLIERWISELPDCR